MAVSTLKVQEDSNYIKETNNRQKYYKTIFIGLGILSVAVLLLCATYTTYQLCNPLASGRVFTKDDEDDIKIQLYKLQSDYYINGIDKEEAKFNNINNNFNSILKLVSSRKPECAGFVTRHSPRRDVVDLERLAKNNLHHFKQMLNGWITNFNYMDLNGELFKLMNDYENIYFQDGDWRDEKVDRRFKRFRDLYDNRIQALEDCVLSAAFKEHDRQQYQELSQQIKLHEDEIEKQFIKFESLDEEIIKNINVIASEKLQCLKNFPNFWQSIQKEKVLAEQLLDVLKFKLKKMRYDLMTADSFDKIDDMLRTQKVFSEKLEKMLNDEIEAHYKTAEDIYKTAMKEIEGCSFYSLY